MNMISKSEVFAENKLFATLDTTVRKVVIDNLFSLQLASPMTPPEDPMPRSGSKGSDTPFASPFDDKPFS